MVLHLIKKKIKYVLKNSVSSSVSEITRASEIYYLTTYLFCSKD